MQGLFLPLACFFVCLTKKCVHGTGFYAIFIYEKHERKEECDVKRWDFNQNWTVKRLDADEAAVPVTLPHDAMRTEARSAESRGEGNIGWYEGGDYEYRKVFTLPEETEGEKLLLEFESIYHNAEIWINGEKAAFRPYGYSPVMLDPEPWLKKGENEIRVIARNADQPNSRWYPGTGIYRPVWLWSGSREGFLPRHPLRIRTLSTAPARLWAEVKTSAPGEVFLVVEDAEGVPVFETRLESEEMNGAFLSRTEFELPGAKLWNTDTPYLYTAVLRFGKDTWRERFGVRTLSWDPEKGIAVNGKRTVLRGACIHHDNGVLGACSLPEAEERRIRILKQAGYNAVRSAHNPASEYLLEACDKLGMLMMDEYVDCWYMHKTENDYASYVLDWWKEDLKDMVEKDYNHPGVILYSTGNEVGESAQEKGIRLQQDFTEYLHSLDDTRPVTCGINIFFNFLSSAGLGVYSDEKAAKQAEAAKKAAEEAKAKPKKKKAVGSEFFNRIAATVGTDFMKLGATLPACDRKTKDVFAAMDIAGYNYGNWRYKHDAKKYPDRLILGSETLIGDAFDFWEIAKKFPQITGDFVWAGWDYIGECGGGGPEFASYKTENSFDQIRGGTCRIDVTGKLTPEADYTRVAFEEAAGPFLAVFPPSEPPIPNLTGWQLSRTVRSWSWPGCEKKKTKVEVYARAAAVELFVNGKSVGKKTPRKGRAVFGTVYEAGELKAKAYGADGSLIGEDRLVTAQEETCLRLEAEKEVCRPGECVYLRLRCTDPNGEVKPLERRRVAVFAEGGEVIGTANGCTYFEGNYAQSEVPLYFGEAQAVVKAGQSGTVRVRITDGSLSDTAQIRIEA